MPAQTVLPLPRSPSAALPYKPHVVILGAGFAGLQAALSLKGVPVSVTVIDRHNHHLFQPLLYRVATAGLSPEDIAMPIRDVLNTQENIQVLMDEVIGIDKASRKVITRTRMTPYDFLIVATGAQYNYFGHEDWQYLAPGLNSLRDAIDLRQRILSAFERAEMAQSEGERGRLMTFVLVGGGPTGVKMAGAVAELSRALSGDFRRIDPRRARIVLMEGGPRLFPGFPQPLGDFAKAALERMGIEISLNAHVEEIGPDRVVAGGRDLTAATTIWCAGVKATPVASWLGTEADTSGRVKVCSDLTIPGSPELFVVGDAAHVPSERGKPLPGLAAVAVQQGAFVAGAIRRRIAGDHRQHPFTYRHRGHLATIGRAAAVANFRRLRLRGWLAWVTWGLVHIYFLVGSRNRLIVLSNWAWSYLTFKRGTRIIIDHKTAVPRPISSDASSMLGNIAPTLREEEV